MKKLAALILVALLIIVPVTVGCQGSRISPSVDDGIGAPPAPAPKAPPISDCDDGG